MKNIENHLVCNDRRMINLLIYHYKNKLITTNINILILAIIKLHIIIIIIKQYYYFIV